MMPGGAKPSLRKAFTAFENRNFRLLFASSFASFIGMQMMMVGRGLLAWDLTGSFATTGFLSLSFGLPMLLLSPFGGATADRFEKRTLMVVARAISGGIALLTAFFILTGVISVPILFGLGLVQGTMFAFMMPAQMAILKELIPQKQFLNAMALSAAAMSGSAIFGPILAIGLIQLSGIEAAYFMLSAMSILSALLVLRLPKSVTHVLPAGTLRTPVMADIRGGMKHVKDSKSLRVLLMMAFVPALFVMPFQIVLPGFATEQLGNKSYMAYILGISGVGAFAGSMALASLGDFKRKALLQLGAGVMMGVALISMGLGEKLIGVPAVLFAALFMGLSMNTYQTLNSTMVMTAADPRFIGRVMSIMMMTFATMPLMAYPIGLLADDIGGSMLFIYMGLTVLGLFALIATFQRSFIFGVSATPATRPEMTAARMEGPGPESGQSEGGIQPATRQASEFRGGGD